MTQTMDTLRNQLAAAVARIAELAGFRSKIAGELEAPEKLSASELRAKQAELADTQGSIELLELRKANLEQDLARVESANRRFELIGKAAGHAKSAEREHAAFLKARSELNGTIKQLSEKLVASMIAFGREKRAYKDTLRALEQTGSAGDVAGHLREAGVSDEAVGLVSNPYFDHGPVLEFAEVIGIIESTVLARMERAERKAASSRAA